MSSTETTIEDEGGNTNLGATVAEEPYEGVHEDDGIDDEEDEDDDDTLGVVSTELTMDRVNLLLKCFEALDKDKDGKLTVKDFRNLGEVMTGTRPSKASALAQLRRADLDDDDEVGKDEWLDFSSNLARMHKTYFEDCIESYIGKLKLLEDERLHAIKAHQEQEERAEKAAQEALDAYVHSSASKIK